MIPLDSAVYNCYVCKKTIVGDIKDSIYLGQSFEDCLRIQYFCLTCWLEVAGEEFMFESPAKEIPLAG